MKPYLLFVPRVLLIICIRFPLMWSGFFLGYLWGVSRQGFSLGMEASS